MIETTNHVLRDFDRTDKELNDLYHTLALKMGLSDSEFYVFYILYNLGDGCLQKDICRETFIYKQTINSAIRKMEKEGNLYLEQGAGRDKHIFLTEKGRQFAAAHIVPVVRKENEAFACLKPKEQDELVRLLYTHTNMDLMPVVSEKNADPPTAGYPVDQFSAVLSKVRMRNADQCRKVEDNSCNQARR